MKVLLAGGDAVSMRALRALLEKWGYEVTVAPDGYVALDALKSTDPPRLALLDWVMPGMDGIEVCRRLREAQAEPFVYVLLLTAKRERKDIEAGLDAGADDCLSKPYDEGELSARLRVGRRIIALQEALLSARDALRIQSRRDPSTGFLDRVAVMHSLRSELERSHRQATPLAVVMGDLDHFERVTGKVGRAEADWALRQAANRIRCSVRTYDSVGRYGDELFLAVLSTCDALRASRLAERLQASVRGRPFDLSTGAHSITLSVGLAANENAKDADAMSLIKAAQLALARAKSQGSDRAVLASVQEVAKVRKPSPSIAALGS